MRTLLDSILVAGISVGIAFAVGTTRHSSPAGSGFPKQTELTGFPFPEDSLLQLKDAGDMPGIRRHAWAIFSGLTEGTTPQWEKWYTKCDVPLQNAHCSQAQDKILLPSPLRNAEFPVQIILPILQSQAAPVQGVDKFSSRMSELTFKKLFIEQPNVSDVFFNPELVSSIRSENLNDETTLEKLLPATVPATDASGAVPDVSRSSIAVKTMWEQITPDLDSPSEPMSLHLWNASLWNQLSNADTGGEANGALEKTNIRIDLSRKSASDCQKSDYPATARVPLGCFRWVKLTGDQYQKLYQSISPFRPKVGDPPYYFVLVGVHIMTRETPEWTWQTFFWSSSAYTARKDLGESISLKGTWGHFEMSATLDTDTPPDTRTHGPNVCTNPYLEGRIDHGMSSNCMYCHARASFSKSQNRGTENDVGSPVYMNGQRPLQARADQTFLAGSVKTRFLWSIANIGQGDTTAEFRKFLLQ